MREPGQYDRWTIVGVASAVLSGAVAFEIGAREYVVFGFSFGACLKAVFLTRWRAWRRDDRADWFYVIFWPGAILGLYWIIKKGEMDRRERIVREVMES